MVNINNKFEFLGAGGAKYTGLPQKTVDFLLSKQLKDKELWRKFTDIFGTCTDDADNGWRGEYFGKMMRGACLTYLYTGDEELYDILFSAVEGILEKQEPSGRISTYGTEHEFNGWDIWARKYVLVGLEYFFDICKDETFKKRILKAMVSHADYITDFIGADKKHIEETSDKFGALNSCSVLDAYLQLYKLTKHRRYLGFSEYIISACGELIKCVEENKLKVFEFPQTKAYELMSFFEGLLTYYECTGKEYYLNIVLKFFDDLQETEQTIIGAMGTGFEFFNNSTANQTEHHPDPMLETCVTVTWIRITARLLALTGDVKFADKIELSAYNALFGTVNFNLLPQYCVEEKQYVEGLPFDSYSPLFFGRRGEMIAGCKTLPCGTHYGCCGAIGAAAAALFPLTAVMTDGEGIVVNHYLSGKAEALLPSGNKLQVEIIGDYPKSGELKVRFAPEREDEYSVRLRIPDWCDFAVCLAGGNEYRIESGYLLFENVSGNTEMRLTFPLSIKTVRLNMKTAFVRGPIVLARDEEKEGVKINFNQTEILIRNEGSGEYAFGNLPPKGDECCRIEMKTFDGRKVILSDYATCGKNWTGDFPYISVWMNIG